MRDGKRLDAALAERGLCASREKAQALILSGVVFVNNQRADKASRQVLPEDTVEVRGAPHPYVSRGGLKLEKALRVFGADVKGVTAIDAGASTGGFTDVLLRAGAAHVYAVDVGYGQLDWKLREDLRVTVMERTNARYLRPEDFPLRPELAVMDVSFISIRLILPALFAVLGDRGRVLTLVKPQFEAGRGQVGKKGVVRDPAVHVSVLESLFAFLEGTGWHVQGMDYSPITGPEGNIEFLLDLVPGEDGGAELRTRVVSLVEEAHRKLREGQKAAAESNAAAGPARDP